MFLCLSNVLEKNGHDKNDPISYLGCKASLVNWVLSSSSWATLDEIWLAWDVKLVWLSLPFGLFGLLEQSNGILKQVWKNINSSNDTNCSYIKCALFKGSEIVVKLVWNVLVMNDAPKFIQLNHLYSNWEGEFLLSVSFGQTGEVTGLGNGLEMVTGSLFNLLFTTAAAFTHLKSSGCLSYLPGTQ